MRWQQAYFSRRNSIDTFGVPEYTRKQRPREFVDNFMKFRYFWISKDLAILAKSAPKPAIFNIHSDLGTVCLTVQINQLGKPDGD